MLVGDCVRKSQKESREVLLHKIARTSGVNLPMVAELKLRVAGNSKKGYIRMYLIGRCVPVEFTINATNTAIDFTLEYSNWKA